MHQKEIVELIENDDYRVRKHIDRYLRDMVNTTTKEIKLFLGKQLTGTSELREELQFLKKVKKTMDEHPNAFLDFEFMNRRFEAYPLIREYFWNYENKIEKIDDTIRGLNLISDLADVVRGERPIASVSVRFIIGNQNRNTYDTEFGILTVGNLLSEFSKEDLECIKENIETVGFKNPHSVAQKLSGILEAEICTGYINTQIPDLKVMNSWLEKNGECYDMNTGLIMRKEEYEHLYHPERVNRISYKEIEGLEDYEEDGISYVCYHAYKCLHEPSFSLIK